MSSLNWSRIFLGGLAAGLVMNIIDWFTNGVLLQNQWMQEMQTLKPGMATAETGMIGWIIVDFLLGIVLVWLYAAIRPRFGAGAGTAVRAGIALWVVATAISASLAFMGLYSASLVAASCLGGLVSTLVGAWVGGYLYREA